MSRRIRVVHVEDDPQFASLTRDYLEQNAPSIDVVSIADPTAVLSHLESHRVDCIVSDFDMPEMDGIALLKEIRQQFETLPFILFTGKGTEEVASAAIRAGVTDYLQKSPGSGQFTLLENRITNAVSQSRSQRSLETLIDNLPGIAYRGMHNRAWEMDFLGGEVEALTGYSMEQLIEGDITLGNDIIYPADREAVWDAVQHAIDHHEPFEVSYRIQPKTGEEKVVWERGQLVESPADEGNVIEGFITDITAQHETEHALRREREFIERALDMLEDIFYVFDADNTLTRWNEQLNAVTGYTDTELDDMEPLGFFAPKDQARVKETINAVYTSGTGKVVAEVITATGDRIPFELTASLLTDPTGDPSGFAGIARNITERREREHGLRELGEILATLHERTRTLLEADGPASISEIAVESIDHVMGLDMAGIWLHDSEHDALQPTAFTPASMAMFDQQPVFTATEQSLAWRAFVEGETFVIDDMQANDERYNPDTPIKSELIVPLARHGVLNIASTETSEFSESDVTIAQLWASTITTALNQHQQEERLRERERDVSRERDRLDEFANLVSHDLRNPLNVATGNLELVQESVDNVRLDQAIEALDRMNALIERMLTLSQEGESVAAFEPVSLDRLCEQCWTNVDTASATLTVTSDLCLRADPARLSQVFENLFRNAIEHAGTDVHITVGPTPDTAGFYLADDGPGIAPDTTDSIFEGGYSTRPSGNGLGLAIVRQIVQAHGWEVTVTNGANGGARFEFAGIDLTARTDCNES